MLGGSGDIGVMYHQRLTASPSRGMASNPVFGTSTGLPFATAEPSYVVRAGWGDRGNGASSNDGGEPWTPFKTQPDPARSASNGLYRSTDGGATFTEVSSCHASHTLGFGKAARGASYPALYMVGATDTITAVYRSDDEAKTWTRINDDRHQWGWTGAAITGDPRVYGRVYIATNGAARSTGSPPDARQRIGVVLTVQGA